MTPVSETTSGKAIPSGMLVWSFFSTFLVALLSWAMIGEGHGSYGPLEITWGPRHLWILAWPFIIAFANSRRQWLRLAAKAACGAYYVWIFAHREDWNDFERMNFHWSLVMWGVVFLLMQISIWLPWRLACRRNAP